MDNTYAYNKREFDAKMRASTPVDDGEFEDANQTLFKPKKADSFGLRAMKDEVKSLIAAERKAASTILPKIIKTTKPVLSNVVSDREQDSDTSQDSRAPDVPPPRERRGDGGRRDLLGRQVGRDLRANYQGLERWKSKVFDGSEPQDYTAWKSTFLAAMSGRNLPQKELALRLNEALNGKALKSVRNHVRIGFHEDTYKQMWKILDHRYGGKFIEDQFVNDLLMDAPQPKDLSVKELEGLLDTFVTVRRYYRRKDRECLSNTNSLLAKLSRQKFPKIHARRYLVYLRESGKVDNFLSMVDWIEDEINNSQRIEREFGPRLKESKDSKPKSGKHSSVHVTHDDHEDTASGSGSPDSDSEQEEDSEADCHAVINNKPSAKFKKTGRSYVKSPMTFSAQPAEPSSFKKCPYCNTDEHALTRCDKFRKLSTSKRYALVKTSRFCYHCLEGPHLVRDCKNNEGRKCNLEKCERYHHRLLHPDRPSHVLFEDTYTNCAELNKIASPGAVSLQTVVCKIVGQNIVKEIVILLDTGANTTLIDKKLAADLKLNQIGEPYYKWFHTAHSAARIRVSKVEFQLQSLDGTVTQTLIGDTIENLTNDTGIVDWSVEKKNFKHLAKVDFPKLPDPQRVYVIIGTDHVGLFAPIRTVHDPNQPDAPMAALTPLGWTCMGRSSRESKEKIPKPEIYANQVLQAWSDRLQNKNNI